MMNITTLSVTKFFAGKGVLLTGSTGFLAKAVAEKLLRDLPETGHIYLLIRHRIKADGSRVDPKERLREEILRSTAFARLRMQHGDNFESYCESKISCVTADLTKPNLGLDAKEFSDLARKLDIIINSAATVVFDERLDWALDLNTMGPSRLMELARAAGGLYVHISTAYVSGRRTGRIPERLVSPLEAIDAQLPAGVPRPLKFDVKEEIARMTEVAREVKAECLKVIEHKKLAPDSEEANNILRKALIGVGMRRAQSLGWNDTYTYTKYLGEQLIKLDHGAIPTVIVRPSIIESSLREPEPGWLDGLRMADPLIIGYGKGRLPDFPGDVTVALDVIPADLVVNGVLSAAAYIGTCAEQRQDKSGEAPFDLFTIASSSANPLAFRSLYDNVHDYFIKHPMTDRSGKPVKVTPWKFPTIAKYRRQMKMRYLYPVKAASAILNGPFKIPGTRSMRAKLRNMDSTLEQLLYYVEIYGPYVTLDCRFEVSHALELLDILTPEDRERFNFDPRLIRWKNYIQDVHIPGLKRNILRMTDQTRTGAGEGTLLAEETAASQKRAGTDNGGRVRGVPQTIVDLCIRGAEKFGRKSFLEIRRSSTEAGAPSSVRISYVELLERSTDLARKLIARLDLHPGDRVALMGENCPEWSLAYMAISRACCTAVPLDRQMPGRSVADILKLVGAKAIILSPGCLKTNEEMFKPGSEFPPALNLFGELEPFAGFAWLHPHASIGERVLRVPSSEMIASILFTSGTTRDPKGVMLSHSNLIADALAVAEVLEPMENDRFLSVLPLHHALEFTGGFLIPMYGGSAIHHLEFLRPKDVADTMKLAEITVVIGVPRLFKLFMDNIKTRIAASGTTGRLKIGLAKGVAGVWETMGGANPRKKIFKQVHDGFGGQLRLFVSGGAALDPDIFYFFKNFGITIVEGYGLTETSPVLTVNPISAPRAGSVGPTVPGVEISIQGSNSDGIGEVLARGPTVMQGYWLNPLATEKSFDNGWYRTGDLGRIDKDGYLHLTGRLKDVIVTSNGKNVYPDEIEAMLNGIPGVKELCVLGLPARSGTGEEVCAIVVIHDDAARPLVQTAIDRVCQGLASYQHISRVLFQKEELPKTSTLKIQRGKLRERCLLADGTTSEGGVPLAKGLSKAGEASSTNAAAASDIFIEVARSAADHTEPKGRVSASEMTPELKLQMDLGIDSIGLVSMLQSLELQFDVTIPQEDEQKLFTLRDVMTVVEKAVKAAGSSGQISSNKISQEKRLWKQSQSTSDDVQAGMRRSFSKSLLQGAFRSSAKVFMNTYLSIECYGLENIPKSGPYILAANHCSHLDSVAIREALGKRAPDLHVMGAKDYFFDTHLKSWFFSTFLNVLPFDREEGASESLSSCKTVLENGRAILIFPEGTRSVSGELQPFKPGVGVLAMELQASVIPVYIRGTYASLPKGKTLPRPSRLEICMGAPVDFSALKAEQGKTQSSELYRRAAQLLRSRIETLANLPNAAG